MYTLEDAILLAVEAHRGQKDKAGVPYILHPLRMAFKMQTETEMIVAVLHDVIEDTAVSLANLRQAGFPSAVLEALDCLTRRENESYDAFIARVKENPLARKVKMVDLEDNLDIRRLKHLTESDLKRLQKYLRAWKTITEPADIKDYTGIT